VYNSRFDDPYFGTGTFTLDEVLLLLMIVLGT